MEVQKYLLGINGLKFYMPIEKEQSLPVNGY